MYERETHFIGLINVASYVIIFSEDKLYSFLLLEGYGNSTSR